MANDTGPNYPLSPAAGSNGVGLFIIGLSPIGDIPAFNFWKTVLSQYANSSILTTLISNVFDYLDQTANLSSFFDLIFNVDTAQGYGLDVWGRIVNIGRVIEVPVEDALGFEEALPSSLGFNQGTFYNGVTLTNNYILSDDAYRTLIMAKAAANITDGSIPATNRILMTLFPGRGNAFVREGQLFGDYFGFAEAENALGFGQAPFYGGQPVQTMSITFVFQFALTAFEQVIVQYSGVLPKPTGVAANISIDLP